MGTISVEFCLANLLYHFPWELPERMAVEDVDMEEAPGLTVRKKISHFDSLLLFVTRRLFFLSTFSMADRSGSQFSFVITMKVTTAPAAHLAFTNLAYCSPSDLSQFAVPR
ncbi:hypothetical protein YC2023_083797 [Brassica napus]